jgi:hypothetical protein
VELELAMLSGLPKLLGRGFLIGYLLPATLFHLTLKYSFEAFSLNYFETSTAKSAEFADLVKVLQSSFFVILSAIILLAVNRPLVRFFEGYGKWNPLKLLFDRRKKKKFKKDVQPILAEMERIDDAFAANESATPQIDEFPAKLYKAVLYFPDQQEFVLPTKFGNVMRALDVYPRVVYGIDSVPTWRHLTMIIPNRVDEKVKDARAIVDFTLNTLALSSLLLLIYLALVGYAIVTNKPFDVAQPGIALALIFVVAGCWFFLPEAAVQWGFAVKAVFDLNRERLAARLGFRLPPSAEQEFEFWENVSQTLIYRSRYTFRKNDTFRRPAGPLKKDKKANTQ